MTKREVAALCLEFLIFFFFKILGLVFSMLIIMTFLGVLALALWLFNLAFTGLGFSLDLNFSAYTLASIFIYLLIALIAAAVFLANRSGLNVARKLDLARKYEDVCRGQDPAPDKKRDIPE